MEPGTRTANGDLTFDTSVDPITQARNNLHYWLDVWQRKNVGVAAPQVMVAAQHMIATLDANYQEKRGYRRED